MCISAGISWFYWRQSAQDHFQVRQRPQDAQITHINFKPHFYTLWWACCLVYISLPPSQHSPTISRAREQLLLSATLQRNRLIMKTLLLTAAIVAGLFGCLAAFPPPAPFPFPVPYHAFCRALWWVWWPELFIRCLTVGLPSLSCFQALCNTLCWNQHHHCTADSNLRPGV